MENKVLFKLDNNKFRKVKDEDSKGYLFDTQINTAKEIVSKLLDNTTRRNHVILAAKMQSGKTGVCNAVINIVNETELKKEMMVDKYFFITGMNDCGLKRQTLKRVYEQVISANQDNTYIGKRSLRNLEENSFFILKNSDLLSYDGSIDNSIIFIDESHYGSNKNNVLTKFLENKGIDWKNQTLLISRNIYIVSISATPFEEIISDTKVCKNIVDLKPTNEYHGVTEFIKNGLVFDANRDDIQEDGEIFDIIKENQKRMINDGISGIIIIRTRKFEIFENNEYIQNNFNLLELSSNGSNIDYEYFNEEISDLVKKNKFNQRLKVSDVNTAYVSPFKIKPLLILVKGAFRAGMTIKNGFKDYIYMVYDYSNKSDTTAQALLGRMCGYRDNEKSYINTHFYVNKMFADMYSDWENDFQNRNKVPCNKIGWEWVDNSYVGEKTEFGSKSCGNIEIPLTNSEILEINKKSKKAKSCIDFMKNYLPKLLQSKGKSIEYDYIGEAVLSGKNNYKSTSQNRRFDSFTTESLVYQFRPKKIKEFIADTGRDYLTKDDLGKKAVFCVLDAEIYKNGEINGNKRLLIYYVEVAQKIRTLKQRSMYKEHKDTSLIA